jgi:hypothetical protein
MRRSSIAIAAVVLSLVAATSTAGAINTYNAEPAPERTEVGAYVGLWDSDDDGVADRFDWVCSGAMVDADTFLTAGHCTTLTDWPDGTRHFVTLEEDFQSLLDAATGTAEQKAAAFLAAGLIVEGDPFTDAGYSTGLNGSDIGVLDFSQRSRTPADEWSFTPATLPAAGQLDKASKVLKTASWTVVGYGTSEAARGPGGHTHPNGGVRLKAAEGFTTLNKDWVKLDMHQNHGWGGACYGDSGGPNFVMLGGQRILASTTITGDAPCYATNVTYRLDTPIPRAFLSRFVALP